MRANKLTVVGSGIAVLFLFAYSPVARAGEVTAPTGTGAQIGGAVDSAAGAATDAAHGTSKENMKKMADDAAKQGESAAKDKAKSAAGEAIDSVGSGAGAH
jgi:hypothetical protein